MIPRAYITQWQQFVPWAQEQQVEQDLLLSRVIVELFSNSFLAERLAFRGGTALYKLHVKPAMRYSEDIDLVQLEASPIGELLDVLRKTLDTWLGEPRRKFKEGRVNLEYHAKTELEPALPLRIKIEINTREHFSILGTEKLDFHVDSDWFRGSAPVTTYCLDELLGTKLRALFQRKKGRDLFDMWAACKTGAVNQERIVTCFRQYLEREGKTVTRAQMEENLREKLDDPRFKTDMEPLLAPGLDYSVQAASEFLFTSILPLIPGEPWKGPVD